MKNYFLFASFLFLSTCLFAQQQIFIKNVLVFNGKENRTFKSNILIQGQLIKKIDSINIVVDTKSTEIIDGKGKYLMPGLIDAHAHLMFESMPLPVLLTSDFGYVNLYASYFAEKQLMRGFTTVRDMGGNTFSLAKAIDKGLVKGPRVFPSGAAISQTGGHGDFGLPTDVPRNEDNSYLSKTGMTAIADGSDQVLLRTREQLRQGASQIKLMAGGGIVSMYDPIDVSQYSVAEIKAAVEAANNWGTYVTVHAYLPESIKTAIAAGVKCIEHGQLIDESTAKLMAEKNIWWCLQPFMDDEDATPFPVGSANWKKQMEIIKGTDNAYALAKKYHIKTAFGIDCLFDSTSAKNQGKVLCKLQKWFTPFEILKMATHDNAELLSMSNKRSPYQEGKLGEISEGAYADLIIVDGNPLEHIKLIENPETNFKLIMKNGVVYKNTLEKK
jgi:imidazolonepropionase-like amidohydrolase